MPAYDYECRNPQCSKTLEIEQKILDPVLTVCPDCNEQSLVRVISKTNFVLQGSGWAKDGYTKRG